ncbi:hypothetical protein lerEdw1_002079 [Lerista edwardsae]|nr:hypothetical protein lerEdw1_002079 [Lerista edwardsae]
MFIVGNSTLSVCFHLAGLVLLPPQDCLWHLQEAPLGRWEELSTTAASTCPGAAPVLAGVLAERLHQILKMPSLLVWAVMGNTWSAQRDYEDQEVVHGTAYSQVSSEPPDTVKNGPVLSQNAQPVPYANGGAVEARVSVVPDNVPASSPKTMEISSVTEANGNNLGKEAKPAPPAARSRFVLAFSRPVPGRTEERATDSSVASAQLDVSSEAPQANKAPSEPLDLAAAAAPSEASDKTVSEASLSEIELTPPTEAEDAAVPKPKELTFFDRLFKVEKAKDKNKKAQDQSQGEVKADAPGVTIIAEEASAGLQSTPDHALQQTASILNKNIDIVAIEIHF